MVQIHQPISNTYFNEQISDNLEKIIKKATPPPPSLWCLIELQLFYIQLELFAQDAYWVLHTTDQNSPNKAK